MRWVAGVGWFLLTLGLLLSIAGFALLSIAGLALGFVLVAVSGFRLGLPLPRVRVTQRFSSSHPVSHGYWEHKAPAPQKV